MNRFRTLDSLQVRILIGMVAALLVAVGGVSYLLRIHYNDRMVHNLQSYALYLSQTVENAFEFAMSVHNMEGIREGIASLDKHQGVQRIFLVGRDRKVVMSSPEQDVGRAFESEDPTCDTCHRHPSRGRSHTAVISVDGQQVLRVAVPIRNEPQCQGCHASGSEVEGMVILDYSLDAVKGSLAPNAMRTTSLFILATVGLALAIGVLMNRLVLRRLNRLEEAARGIGEGDFGRRVEVSGGDEIDRLGSTFNRMAGSLEQFTRKIEADRDFLDRLINSIEDKITVFDRDLRVVAANRAATLSCERERADSVCEEVCALHSEWCGKDDEECLVAETFETGRPQRTVHRYSDRGTERYAEVLTAPVGEEGGQVAQVVCVCRDITERRMMETELIRSERLASLGRLAAGVAHEINNPMASVAACAEGLQRRLRDFDVSALPGLADLPEYLETIRSAAYEGKKIAGKLLNLSRRTDVDIRDTGPNEVVEEVVSLIRHGAVSEGKAVRMDLHPDVPDVSADRSRLAHALSNLIQNGLDAAGESGEVRVATRPNRGGVHILVEDSGGGIPEADLERIFEPFFTTKPPGKGTGLGLSISERTIRDHGGTLSVESRVGEGTRFTVFLPALSGDGGRTASEREGAGNGRTHSRARGG